MYFTQIELNPVRRQTKRFLGEPETLHAAVSALFPRSCEDVGRILWRVDSLGKGLFLYVVSEQKPDATSLIEQAGWSQVAPARSVEYDSFLQSIENGQRYNFRLTANPTHTPWIQGKRGKPVSHVTERYQRQWFMQKCPLLGIQCHDALDDNATSEEYSESAENFLNNYFVIRERGKRVFYKKDHAGNRHQIPVAYATYEGALLVKDADKLRAALCAGVGRKKAYGYGLLTLAKIQLSS